MLSLHWLSSISEIFKVELNIKFMDNFVFLVSESKQACNIYLKNKEGRWYGFVKSTESCQCKYRLVLFLRTIRNWKAYTIFLGVANMVLIPAAKQNGMAALKK